MAYQLLFAQFHTNTNSRTFNTLQGLSITQGLNKLASKFDLSFLFGTAPHDFTLSRYVKRTI